MSDQKEEEDDYDGPWIERRIEWKCPDRKRHNVVLFGSWNRFKGGDELEYQGKQVFACTVKLPLGTYVYRFLIDGEDWETHNNAGKTARNGIEYNQVHVTEDSDDEFEIDQDFVDDDADNDENGGDQQQNTALIYEGGKLTVGKKRRGRPSVELDLGTNFAADAEESGDDDGLDAPYEKSGDESAGAYGDNEATTSTDESKKDTSTGGDSGGTSGGTTGGGDDDGKLKKKKRRKKGKKKRGKNANIQQEKEWARYVFVQQLRQQQQHNDEINRVKTLWKQERQVRVEMHKKVVKQLKEAKKKLQEDSVDIEKLQKQAKIGKDSDEKLSGTLKQELSKLEKDKDKLREELKNKELEFTEYRKARINDDKENRQNTSTMESKERKYTQQISSLNAEIKALKSTQSSLQSNINTLKDGSNKTLELKAQQFAEREKQWELEKKDLNRLKDEIKKFKSKISKLETSLNESKDETASEHKKCSTQQKKCESLQNKIESLQSTLENLKNSSEAAEKIQIEVNKVKVEKEAENKILSEKANSFEKQLSEQKKFYDTKLTELADGNKAEVAALQANSDKQMTEHINKLKSNINERDINIGKQKEVIGKLEGSLNEEKANNDGLCNKLDALNAELDSCKKDKTTTNKDYEELKNEYKLKQEEYTSTLNSSEASSQEQLSKIKNLENDLKNAKEDNANESKSNEERTQSLESQINDLKKSLNDKNESSSQLTTQLTECQSELDGLKNSESTLREQCDQLKLDIIKEQELLISKSKEFEESINKITNEMEQTIESKDKQMNNINDELSTTKHELTTKLEEFSNAEATIKGLEIDLSAETQKLGNERKDHAETLSQNAAKDDRIQKLCKSLFTKFTVIRDEMKSIQETQISQVEEVQKFFSDFGPLLGTVFEFNQTMIDDLLTKYKRELSLRRKYFNMVQDLRGNIRVFCRVRPLLAFEIKKKYGTCMKFPEEGAVVVSDTEKKKKVKFEFDQVYVPDTSQEQVSEDATEYIQSVMDGYNVSIFAYGQTGSGKTYTMEGPKENPGVNLRALKHLFKIAEERSPQFQYKITVSSFEIYNERINDLILGAEDVVGSGKNKKKKKKKEKKKKQEKFKIRHLPDGSVEVVGLTWIQVKSDEDIIALNKYAKKNRSSAATDMNAHSSRSHMLLVVDVHGINIPANIKYFGKLYLVDLAGSERVKKSGATGQSLKEAQNINKSLSALGDVMQALQRKEKFIPYRNSTLTDLMANALGGNAKTIMFINCCPTDEHVFESLSSLKFAQRVGKVELGQAKKNTKKKKEKDDN